MKFSLVTQDAFHVVGIPWTGTYAQAGAGEIRHVLAEVKRRYREIPHNAEPQHILGLSHEHHADGFSYLLGARVHDVTEVPAGMVSRLIPRQTYATAHVAKGSNIQEAYRAMFAWMEENGYKEKHDVVTHLEVYAADGDAYDPEPELTIMTAIQD
ncbi:GyrI-like domain-containing protein [Brevibacillus migulae]|uniref:GyrI-like domain-containing protein n=1 Tax=Brevibacillus migulae TaxID=1644114 RepID=UPI00106E4480|nr:GyrI-like domain-containing protein [Brevibacillus migulae]